MNIEELSKSQLILLTILVNFVTSVATGVLTVSLLDQAPPIVAKTVNEIVDHTIETVAAAAPIVAPASPAPSNQDLVTGALAADASRVVAIYGADGTSSPAVAIGTYLPSSRAVATASGASLPQEATIGFSDGSLVAASLSKSGGGIAIYGFADKATLPVGAKALFISAKDLKLGQTVLTIAKDGSAETGIIARVDKDGIHTTLANSSAGPGAVDLAGDIIGIASGAAAGDLVSADQILALLTATSTAATSTPAHS